MPSVLCCCCCCCCSCVTCISCFRFSIPLGLSSFIVAVAACGCGSSSSCSKSNDCPIESNKGMASCFPSIDIIWRSSWVPAARWNPFSLFKFPLHTHIHAHIFCLFFFSLVPSLSTNHSPRVRKCLPVLLLCFVCSSLTTNASLKAGKLVPGPKRERSVHHAHRNRCIEVKRGPFWWMSAGVRLTDSLSHPHPHRHGQQGIKVITRQA